jgi:hypothetical protein
MKNPLSLRRARMPRALALACALAAAGGAHAATWTKLSNRVPGSAGTSTMFLLTDGTVMVKSGDAGWMRLSPSATGSYAEGTWSSLADMSEGRQWFASHVLPDGNVWILGGEYSGPDMAANWTNTGEIYDTLHDTWSPIANHPEANYGDVPSMLLEGNRILTGSLSTRKTYTYDVATNAWSRAAQKAYDDQSDEEGWVKLGDGSIMTYDIFHSIQQRAGYAEIWNQKSGKWTGRSPADGTASGTLPLLSDDSVGDEMGPVLKLRSPANKGTVLFVGANGHNALYTVGTRAWTQLPDLTDVVAGKSVLFGADDAPGAEMPGGHVIVAADEGPTKGTFTPPTHLFDFDPGTNTFSPLQPAFPDANYWNIPCFEATMLMLPTGQLLIGNSSQQLYLYTPDGAADKKSLPVFQGLHYDGSARFTLTGTRLNGVSAGATYGDDAEADENYPIVRFRGADGSVWYARSTNWSNARVADADAETVQLTLKAGMPAGDYEVTISGAGIASKENCLAITAQEAAGTGAPAQVMPGTCGF